MGINPFDLRGPEFLLFYLIFSGVVLVLIRLWLRRREWGDPGRDNTLVRNLAPDPYRIAFLRAGKTEVIRVAVVSLIERGLLIADGSLLRRSRPDAMNQVRRPLDKAILSWVGDGRAAVGLLTDPVAQDEAEAIGIPLYADRLLADAVTAARRLRTFLLTAGVLIGVAGAKIVIALSRGHHNIAFLILLGIASVVIAACVVFRHQTSSGRRILNQLREWFTPLRERGASAAGHGDVGEMLFLCAVFGLDMLPGSMVQTLEQLKLKAKPSDSSSGDGGSGSSCGSGGSCGGGGCGGCGS